jgi:hypothetical protein
VGAKVLLAYGGDDLGTQVLDPFKGMCEGC